MKRKVLGRGLDALLPGSPPEGTPATVDIDLLMPNPRQPRMRFSEEPLEELARSIQENGIVQPIVVRNQEDRYEIVAGERRWRAAQRAGLLKVPIVLLDVPDDRMLELAVLENIQREDLNPIDEARAYHLLLEEQGCRQEDLAQRLGKARTSIANSIRLLQLPERVQEMLETRQLTPGQARPLITVQDAAIQNELAERIVKRGMSARDVERLVSRIGKKSKIRETQAADPDLMAAVRKLSERLATRVRIQPGGKGNGQITIQYGSQAELERLYDLLIGDDRGEEV